MILSRFSSVLIRHSVRSPEDRMHKSTASKGAWGVREVGEGRSLEELIWLL